MARSRGARRWPLAVALVVAGLLASGCSSTDLPRFGWPEGVTEQARRMQGFWSWSVIAALAIGVLVWALMFWSFFAYRKKKNSPTYPKQTKENLPLELVYTAVPLVMVAVLFYFTVTTENFVLKKDAQADVTVDVVAQKWAWDFGYQGTVVENVGGEVHTIGTSDEVPILVLPVGKTIEYHLESQDVIHSFWVPDFLFKRDVFPDPEANATDNVFQNKIERTGAFVGRCAELCGTYHSAMNFEVRAVPENIYNRYIELRQQVDQATGAPYTAAAALIQVGSEFPECGDLCAERSTTTYPLDPDREAKAASQPQAGGS
ncbi:aa3-type cytochrome oxidase subunit II [Nakamurella alba]|uniref:aa3-type cytochrome oxidase subunit II n=1 Tax=Nakamurella alba TaxID=2665158 RepID=UPI002AC32B81|nr:cytochrome c oxidase subunit II [Nakamurella alba]